MGANIQNEQPGSSKALNRWGTCAPCLMTNHLGGSGVFPQMLFSVHHCFPTKYRRSLGFWLAYACRHRRDHMTGTICTTYSIGLTLKITRVGPKLNLFVVHETRLPPTVARDSAGLTDSSKFWSIGKAYFVGYQCLWIAANSGCFGRVVGGAAGCPMAGG